MVDFENAKAQYIRLTHTGGQKNGFSGAIWNIKVYGSAEIHPHSSGSRSDSSRFRWHYLA